MSRTVNKCAIFLALLMVVQLSSGGMTRRRRDDDGGGLTGFLNKIEEYLRMIPLIGNTAAGSIEKTVDAANKVEDMTNGAVGRLLGGAFPCTFTRTNVMCEGVSSRNDASQLMESLLKLIPGLMFPGIFKSMTMIAMDAGLAPLIDILLGGVPIES